MRFCQILDIRETPLYDNHNIRLVYLHLCLSADNYTHEVSLSRSKAVERIGVTDNAYRHALQQLQKYGFIQILEPPKSNQGSDQGATKGATKTTTIIKVVTFNELSGANNQPNNQGNNQGNNQEPNQGNNHIINKKNNTEKIFTLSAHTREVIFASVDAVGAYCRVTPYQAEQICKAFANAMTRKRKTWSDDNDLLAHLLDWSFKHLQGAKNMIVNNTTQEAQEPQEAPKESREKTNAEGWADFRAMLEREAKKGDVRAQKELEKRGWL